MFVPAGRGHACPVAAAVGEASAGPGNPGSCDLHSFEATQRSGIVFASLQRLLGQNGRMPGAAHHSDALEALFLGGANRLAHMCFALSLALIFGSRVGTQLAHRLQNALKQPLHIPALLNLALPPDLVIAIAGGTRQEVQRVLFYWLRLLLLFCCCLGASCNMIRGSG